MTEFFTATTKTNNSLWGVFHSKIRESSPVMTCFQERRLWLKNKPLHNVKTVVPYKRASNFQTQRSFPEISGKLELHRHFIR